MTGDAGLLVFCTCPDQAVAERIAGHVVGEGLAACVNVLPGIGSVYLWEGRVNHDREALILIKTTRACYAALEAAVARLHPYELPEIIAVPVTAGLPAYLEWVNQCTDIPR